MRKNKKFFEKKNIGDFEWAYEILTMGIRWNFETGFFYLFTLFLRMKHAAFIFYLSHI